MNAHFRLVRFITDMRLRDTLTVGALVLASGKAKLVRGPLPKSLPPPMRFTIESILDRIEATRRFDDNAHWLSLHLLIEPPCQVPADVPPEAWVEKWLSFRPEDPTLNGDETDDECLSPRRRRVSLGRDWLHRHDVDRFVASQFKPATRMTGRPSQLLGPFSQYVAGARRTMILEPFAPVAHRDSWKRQVTEVAKGFALLSAMIREGDVDLSAELVAYFVGASEKHISSAQELFAEVHDPPVRVVDAGGMSGLDLIHDIRTLAHPIEVSN